MSDIFDFQWEVGTEGYRWITTRAAEENAEQVFLTDGVPFGKPFRRRFYAPLHTHRGLFRSFAEVPPTPDGILAFAKNYGLLGGDVSMQIVLPDSMSVGIGELLRKWQDEILSMRRVLTLWDMVERGDAQGLAQHIQWTEVEKTRAVRYVSHPHVTSDTPVPQGETPVHTWIATRDFRPELLERFRPGDVIQPALYYIQRVVNDHLQGRVSPRLLWNADRTRLGDYLVPDGLIGALWLQFYQAISGNKEYRRCEQCGTWFEVSHQAARTSRLFCSNACRSRAYREKQAEANRLHAQGVSLTEIAKRLGTTAKTARGWVGKAA